MCDGGFIANLGQSQLTLSDTAVGRNIGPVFPIAAVTRPLMSVGRICDEGRSITFDAVMAVVHAKAIPVFACNVQGRLSSCRSLVQISSSFYQFFNNVNHNG